MIHRLIILLLIVGCDNFFQDEGICEIHQPPMIRRLIILLLIVGYLFADVQLVNDYRVIIIKDGQKFSINDDSKKYKFESINFDLG